MYLDSLEFLEDEHDGWTPYEALLELDDAQLERPIEAAHGWSGRDLIGHLLAWQAIALDAARELAVDETSPTIARVYAEWEARGGDVVNEELAVPWAAMSMTELRDRFRTQPGELRGYLTVVPEARWLKHADHLQSFQDETIDHYRDHLDDLRAILAAASPG